MKIAPALVAVVDCVSWRCRPEQDHGKRKRLDEDAHTHRSEVIFELQVDRQMGDQKNRDKQVADLQQMPIDAALRGKRILTFVEKPRDFKAGG